jgi:peptidoglycan-associated lipoprotein
MLRRALSLTGSLLFMAVAAHAQQPAAQGQQPAPPTSPPAAAPSASGEESRPATNTFLGDTGLWFVPTGEVLQNRRWSASGYFTNFDYTQGFTDVSHYIATFGYGLGGRAELFGSFRLVTLVDRDSNVDGNTLFSPDPRYGGVVNEHPLMASPWSGGQIGDLFIGAKVNLASESKQQPVAFAVRGIIKLPTGDDTEGAGTGKADFLVDAIVSKEVNQRAEVTGYGGFIVRGDPSGVDLSNGFRWGFGVGGPSRSPLRAFAELHGEFRSSDEVTLSRSLVGTDGSIAPTVSDNESITRLTAGVTWQSGKGLFLGTAANWDLPVDSRDDFGRSDGGLDKFSIQFRVGFHPGVGVYVPPPPPPTPAPAPPQNRPPTVKARCNPCTVEIGKSSTVTADGQDPDGDTLTYKWSAPTGKFANPAERETLWTAPNQEGTVPVTVTVDDGKGGTATDTVNIQVMRPAVKEYVFEDVHFDFDRYTLREEATRILAEAVKALRENPTLRIEIEGHTCNIGTAEYNLALGERRANAVRDYLASNGITADRLRTVSYGEERPKHDNAREETRRLNRRAALTVRLQQQ